MVPQECTYLPSSTYSTSKHASANGCGLAARWHRPGINIFGYWMDAVAASRRPFCAWWCLVLGDFTPSWPWPTYQTRKWTFYLTTTWVCEDLRTQRHFNACSSDVAAERAPACYVVHVYTSRCRLAATASTCAGSTHSTRGPAIQNRSTRMVCVQGRSITYLPTYILDRFYLGTFTY